MPADKIADSFALFGRMYYINIRIKDVNIIQPSINVKQDVGSAKNYILYYLRFVGDEHGVIWRLRILCKTHFPHCTSYLNFIKEHKHQVIFLNQARVIILSYIYFIFLPH